MTNTDRSRARSAQEHMVLGYKEMRRSMSSVEDVELPPSLCNMLSVHVYCCLLTDHLPGMTRSVHVNAALVNSVWLGMQRDAAQCFLPELSRVSRCPQKFLAGPA
jgi:hypothetical protein